MNNKNKLKELKKEVCNKAIIDLKNSHNYITYQKEAIENQLKQGQTNVFRIVTQNGYTAFSNESNGLKIANILIKQYDLELKQLAKEIDKYKKWGGFE